MKRRIIALLTSIAFLLTLIYFSTNSNAGIQTLNLSKQEKSIKVGESFQLTMAGVKASSIKWKSSKPGVVAVSKKGVIKGIKAGTANITGKYKNLKFTVVVTVTSKRTPKEPEKNTDIPNASESDIYIGTCADVDFYYVKSAGDYIYIKYINNNTKERIIYTEYINLDDTTYNVGNWSSVMGKNFRTNKILYNEEKVITPKKTISMKVTVEDQNYKTIGEDNFSIRIK
ncbi:MAG: Ig-like domain-containing protein [Eubacterium sp.]|nr:Ig-like domain-containing protein [Eubacterium sp.]